MPLQHSFILLMLILKLILKVSSSTKVTICSTDIIRGLKSMKKRVSDDSRVFIKVKTYLLTTETSEKLFEILVVILVGTGVDR